MKLYSLRRLRGLSTPLEIRHSIRRLRACPNTLSLLYQLLHPHPWYFATPPLLSYEDLHASPEVINISLFRARDTSLRSLYRLYDDLCADRRTLMTYECEYFFRRGSERWSLSRIADPCDEDPVRYAVLASLVEALVEAFNWKLELGIRRGGRPCDQSEERPTNFVREVAPGWTGKVGAVEKRVSLIDQESEPFAKADENFLRRNIEAGMGYLYTV
ncbi:hypothetical protein VE03_01796 [Pseudogymnoascus sp. 23342-1-I1]|nr:hypothetical protein VE03_01796 [Pseudogymnoascus sp. 23342-1-I1]